MTLSRQLRHKAGRYPRVNGSPADKHDHRNAIRRLKYRVTKAIAKDEHVVVRWYERTYNGHLERSDRDPSGFRLRNHEDGGVWLEWEWADNIEIQTPWWDIAQSQQQAVDNYRSPCPRCPIPHTTRTQVAITRASAVARPGSCSHGRDPETCQTCQDEYDASPQWGT